MAAAGDCALLVVEVALAAVDVGEVLADVFSLSIAKRLIATGLPLSSSWKSSCFRLSIACPLESRTTTRTSTRFTFTLNVAVSSREVISAGALAPFVADEDGPVLACGHAPVEKIGSIDNCNRIEQTASERVVGT